MSKANKRERQRQNREVARQLQIATQRRRRRMKMLRNFTIAAVLMGVIFAILQLTAGDDKKKTVKAAGANCKVGKQPENSPPLTIDPNAKYKATIDTTQGVMIATLDTKCATWGANNFITLARKGTYDGLIFHRTAKDFVIQGGDPAGDGSGGPGYMFISEVPRAKYRVGDLAYAKPGSDPNGSTGSQFFVITSPKALKIFNAKPYQYGDFGHVTKGLEVAQKIESFAPPEGDGKPTTEVKINKVTIEGPPPVETTATTVSGDSSSSAPPTAPTGAPAISAPTAP